MIKPTIHRNGTSAEELRNGYAEAYSAVGSAIHAVHQTAPHGRDYYVQGSEATGNARREHQERIDRLVTIQAELLGLHESCDE